MGGFGGQPKKQRAQHGYMDEYLENEKKPVAQ